MVMAFSIEWIIHILEIQTIRERPVVLGGMVPPIKNKVGRGQAKME
jgi:hypothetical protein